MNWYHKLKEVHSVRDSHIAAAESKAKDLGHSLGPWTAFLTNRCSRCGMTVALHNVLAQTDAADHSGRAVTDKCDVSLDGGYLGEFDLPLAKKTLL